MHQTECDGCGKMMKRVFISVGEKPDRWACTKELKPLATIFGFVRSDCGWCGTKDTPMFDALFESGPVSLCADCLVQWLTDAAESEGP